ncbi:MAG: insulinase family protein [Clostridium butyricum]|nr:insulinase family protein [Clostridium butyricum]
MKQEFLENNLKVIYEHREGELSSICISFDAGAGAERACDKMGTAHAVEHMVYKGTKKRSEAEINEELSSVFGFQNAMTNYPYCIYYGTLLSEDFEKGIEIFSDILINPAFNESGFEEEMNVIKEELNEWDEDLEQYCEDKLFINAFDKRRIKYPIIGVYEDLNNMTLDDIKKFYKENYFPENAVITVVTSLKYSEVMKICQKYFGQWKSEKSKKHNILEKYEMPKKQIFYDEKKDLKTCKIQAVFPIDELCEKEIKNLRIFNQFFGEGVNSLLYDNLRTKNGLVYDVLTRVAYENYIKLYKITFTTSKENVDKTLDILKKCINSLEKYKKQINEDYKNKLVKSFKLKRLFREEQSIVMAKELSTYDTMFGNGQLYLDEISELDTLTIEDIFKTAQKVLSKCSIQVIY